MMADSRHKFETSLADEASWNQWRESVPDDEVVDRLYALVSANSKHILHYRALIVELATRERPLEALHFAKHVYRFSKTFIDTRNLTFLCCFTGEFDEAVKLIELMRDNGASPGVCLCLLATAHIRAGNIPMAAQVLMEAIQYDKLDQDAENLFASVALLSADDELVAAAVERFGEDVFGRRRGTAIKLLFRRLIGVLEARASKISHV